MFLQELDNLPSFPHSFDVNIPADVVGLRNSITGSLNLSREGYIYSTQSKTVIWLKFLA